MLLASTVIPMPGLLVLLTNDTESETCSIKLKVVQKNQVFIVGVYWVGNGPISANRVIDDLFRYLVKQSSGLVESPWSKEYQNA